MTYMAQRGERMTYCRNGHPKTPENVYVYRTKNGSVTRLCRTCRTNANVANRKWLRDYQLVRRYGISRQERSRLLIAQDGLCGICYERPAVTVDHDHATGRVRGMLCKACNVALGVLGDDVESLQRVIEYLTQPDLSEVV
jgi:hypothetical protein